VLVNNAGVERAGSIEELPLSEFRAVMETNYFGVLRCIQAVLPHMRERSSGCIINVSSVAGRISNSPLTPYMTTKWALEALSEGLAGEMKMFNVRGDCRTGYHRYRDGAPAGSRSRFIVISPICPHRRYLRSIAAEKSGPPIGCCEEDSRGR